MTRPRSRSQERRRRRAAAGAGALGAQPPDPCRGLGADAPVRGRRPDRSRCEPVVTAEPVAGHVGTRDGDDVVGGGRRSGSVPGLGEEPGRQGDDRRDTGTRRGAQRHPDRVPCGEPGRRRGSPAAARPPGRPRGVGEQLVRGGELVGRHADAPVLDRQQLAAPRSRRFGPGADGDGGVRRREAHRVLGQLGQQVGQVGDRVTADDRDAARRPRTPPGRGPRSRRSPRARRRAAAPGPLHVRGGCSPASTSRLSALRRTRVARWSSVNSSASASGSRSFSSSWLMMSSCR